ncbi:MAG TPA: hypothetical protein VM818_20795 [Vicinamibacterales bacterium]|jgi:hypothetical protein|nr:hypothetical protein [Vicinamibacterales bacterium]
MTWAPRRALVPLVGVITFSSVLAGCSGSSANGAVGTSGDAGNFIAVDTASPPVVTLQNMTDQPLVDINVALKSGILLFSDSISRLEPKEKRQLRHGDFASRDGTPFSLRIARPREVILTAKDLSGKQMEATVPWK